MKSQVESRNGYYFLIFCIVLRSIFEVLNLSFYGDQYIQAQTVFNFIEGNGFTVTNTTAENLAGFNYEKLQSWPVGFTVVVSILMKVIGDIELSVGILNCLAIVVFFFSWHKLLQLLEEYIPTKHGRLILLFWAVCIFPFRYMGATDLWSLSLISCVGLLLIKLFYSTGNKSYFYGILISILLASTGTLRYAYWPFIAFLPAFILIYSIIYDKNKIGVAIVTYSATLILFGCYSIWQIEYFGQLLPGFTENRQTELLFGNLKFFSPLTFNMLFRDSIFWKALAPVLKTGLAKMSFLIFLQLISLLLLIPFFMLLLSLFKGISLQKKPNVFDTFTLMVIWVVGINIAFLIYASLTRPSQPLVNYPLGYTQVADNRYFAPSMIFVMPIFVYAWHKFTREFLQKALITAVFSFALIINALFLGARFDLVSGLVPKYGHNRQKHIDFYTQIKKLKAEENSGELIYMFDFEQVMKYRFFARLADCAFLKVDTPSIDNLNTSETVRLIVLIDETSKPSFIQKVEAKGEKLLDFESEKIYILTINPR